MREIRFRAWDTEYNCMDNDFFIGSYAGVYDRASTTYDTPHIEIEKVNNLKIMQYTGLKDFRGIEIYEGDIVRVEHTNYYETEIEPEYKPWIGKVIFKEGGYYIQTGCDYHPSLSNIRIVSINVLGNVFENPELLEGEK